MFRTTTTTCRLIKRGWAPLLSVTFLLIPAVTQAQQPTPAAKEPPAADNRRDFVAQQERAAIQSLRPESAAAGEANGGPAIRGNRFAPALAGQDAELEAARAEVRSLAAAFDQASRRLAEMERAHALQRSTPGMRPMPLGGDALPPAARSPDGSPFNEPQPKMSGVGSAGRIGIVPPPPNAPAPMLTPRGADAPVALPTPGSPLGGLRGGGRFVTPNSSNIEQRLEALENQLRALHEEVRQTMREMNRPSADQQFQPPTTPQPPPRPGAPAAR